MSIVLERIAKLIKFLLLGLIFLLPFQTRLIYKLGLINGNPWEYGTESLYGTEILLGIIILLALVYFALSVFKNKQLIFWHKNELLSFRMVLFYLTTLLLLINVFIFALDKGISVYKLTSLILSGAFICLLIVFKPKITNIYYALVASATFQSILAIEQFVSQKVLANKWLGVAAQDPNTLGTPVVEISTGRWLRTFGTLPHPNILAGFLLIALIFIIGLTILNDNRRTKKLLTLFFIINLVGLLTTLSRGAIFALALAIIIWSFIKQKDKEINKKISKYVLVSVFIIIAFSVSFPELIGSRTLGQDRLENISNTSRLTQYSEFWQIYKSNWLSGIGLNNYTVAEYLNSPGQSAWDYQPMHNAYLLIIAELGLMGLIVVISYLAFLISKFKQRINFSQEQLIAFISLLAISIVAIFDHYLWSFYFGLLLFSLVMSLNIRQEEQEK